VSTLVTLLIEIVKALRLDRVWSFCRRNLLELAVGTLIVMLSAAVIVIGMFAFAVMEENRDLRADNRRLNAEIQSATICVAMTIFEGRPVREHCPLIWGDPL